MTRFQARYVQWLSVIGCTLRATAGHYYRRYDGNDNFRGEEYEGSGGNQIDGFILRERAYEVLKSVDGEPLYLEPYGVEIDGMEFSYCKWKRRLNEKVN